MNFERSKTYLWCLCYVWTKSELTLWVSWINDCIVIGEKKGIKKAKEAIIDRFDCYIIGNMDEYVGYKLKQNFIDHCIKFTQPVLLQIYTYKFNLGHDKEPSTPANPGLVLMPCKEEDGLVDGT
jgi:uroporphyrinogen-III decarboxylase